MLAVADEVNDALWGARAATLDPDLVLAAGDLPWDYLEFLASVTDRPVVFVPGNHDPAVVDARLEHPLEVRRLVHRPGEHGGVSLVCPCDDCGGDDGVVEHCDRGACPVEQPVDPRRQRGAEGDQRGRGQRR